MSRRLTVAAGTALALAVAGAYRLPRPSLAAEELYADADPATFASLADFRATTPVRHLALDGHAWEYVVVGDGPDMVLFLHGLSGAHDIWWQQLEGLAATHRTIAVTYPPVHTLSELAAGVVAILDAHDAATVAVVGSSLGGYLAQYLVQRHPERIDRAVFANTFPPNDQLRQAHHLRAAVGRFLPERVVAWALRDSNARKVVPASRDIRLVAAYLTEQSQAPGLKRRLLARYHTVVEPFDIQAPDAAGPPILLLESDNDPLIDAGLQASLRSTYPAATVHTFAGGGHFPYLDRPGEYTAVLRGFLG